MLEEDDENVGMTEEDDENVEEDDENGGMTEEDEAASSIYNANAG